MCCPTSGIDGASSNVWEEVVVERLEEAVRHRSEYTAESAICVSKRAEPALIELKDQRSSFQV